MRDDRGRSGSTCRLPLLETNPLFEEMSGLVEPVGKTALQLVPDLEPHWVETYARAALGGERFRFEQGSEAMGRWFDVFTMPVSPPGRFAIVFKDETLRKRNELALLRSEERYRQLAAEEHRIARRLQRALLPAGLVQHPLLEIEAHYHADHEMLEVGGDWYDTFIWPNGHVGVMVGDVVGHDLDAAAAMGHLRAAVAALAPHTNGRPAAMLAALDECVRGPNGADFVTASCIVIDPANGRMAFASAGHLPVLIVTSGGHAHWVNHASGPPLGTTTAPDHLEGQATLDPGSVVMMFTDGLVERRGESLDVGLARFRDLATTLVPTIGQGLGPAIAEAAAEHSSPIDDVVLVTVRYGGS